MYLVAITISLCVSYILLYFIFPFFFTNHFVNFTKNSILSLVLIFILSIFGYCVVFNISDAELGNRVLHGFGGGFMALYVCFLVVKDTKLKITQFQFITLSFLIVASLGIANEILEFILQNYFGIVIATSINDTWYDLISNTVGSIIAILCLSPFIKTRI